MSGFGGVPTPKSIARPKTTDDQAHAPEEVTLPRPAEPGTEGDHLSIMTNIFPVEFEDHKTLYRYSVTIYGTSRDVENFDDVTPMFLTTATLNDLLAVEKRAVCGAAMALIMDDPSPPFADRKSLFYDYRDNLFSTERMEGEQYERTFRVARDEHGEAFSDYKLINVTIRACAIYGQVSTEQLAQPVSTLEGVNRDKIILKFVEIALDKHALETPQQFLVFENGKVYLKGPLNFGVDSNELKRLPEGKELMVGSQKSVKLVGLENQCGVAVDAKKAVFHCEMDCGTKAFEITGFTFKQDYTEEHREKLCAVFKGVTVSTMYSKRRYKVVDVRDNSFYKITVGGREVTVADYFREKYNHTFLAPRAPLLVVQSAREVLLPIEVCRIESGQRVTISQQTQEQMRNTTKECALPPLRRQNIIMSNLRALGICADGLAQTAGFRVSPTPLTANARLLGRPTIAYNRQNLVQVSAANYSWRLDAQTKFLSGGVVKKWGFYTVSHGGRVNISQDVAQRIHKAATGRNVAMPVPFEMGSLDPSQFGALFEHLKQSGADFVMFATDDRITCQDQIKYLERKYEITTQNIRLKTAREIIEKNKGATVENLVNKLNIKTGGINYTIKVGGGRFLMDNKTMVIGIGTVKPPPGSTYESANGRQKMPSVVGYSANICREVESFCGDFDLVDAHDENAQLVGHVVLDHALNRWEEYERPIPERVVVYRAGLADSFFDKLASVEVPRMLELFKTRGICPKLTYIIVAKDHSVRLFNKTINGSDKPSQQNIKPGVVVDSVITNPKLKQFYLNSHVTLQGTALTPLYTVLHDGKDHSLNELQRLTYDLCYLHEIVNLPTSIPTPLYVANLYADRGKRLFAFDVKTGVVDRDGGFDGARARLQYQFSSLFVERRVNA